MVSFAEIVRLDSYRAKPHPDAIIAADDREYCEKSVCPRCAHEGRSYRPFIRRTAGELVEYRFYAVCGCGFSEEI